jgi:hypothetical protein
LTLDIAQDRILKQMVEQTTEIVPFYHSSILLRVGAEASSERFVWGDPNDRTNRNLGGADNSNSNSNSRCY